MYDIPDWSTRLTEAGMAERHAIAAGSWMNDVLGTAFTREEQF